ncbi:delta-60 repeat domain-containing protein [Ramlibacter alkalitolerans]|uniref:Uncharacterized protein n=1 Tax=Ramlibacter alkalitolerans TaxID=2039631 RepID=A0ABS1JL35_9BURK|nr:delta-60 repeat domain-containing protein [Ramlibacter alkalitolerans]MBL0424933.1 hypothetical protein [Ramlibacter alkalitolerans]
MALAILTASRAAAMAFLGTGALFLACASSAWAAPGDLDPTFGSVGKVTTPIFAQASDGATVYAVTVQSNGKIVAAGSAFRAPQNGASSGSDFVLARYNTNGSLDTSFGGSGKVTKDIGGGQDYAYAVVVQPDGKIVAAGSAEVNAANANTRFTLVRYNPDGSLDSGFGTAGVVSTDFFGTENMAAAVAIQADGRIVVAGRTHDGIFRRFALARYSADGSLDASFGTGGKVTTSFFGFDNGATGVVVQADGKIVASGWADPGGPNVQFAMARYNADGSLDAGFGTGGKVTTDFFGANDVGWSLLLQGDGKLVIAGLVLPSGFGSDVFGLVRYNTDGSLDTSFGAGGKTTLSFSFSRQRRLAAALQPDGKILAVSWGVDGSTGFDVFSLARFNGNGAVDLGFGNGGKVITNVLGSQSQAYALAVQGDGRILAAGSAFDSSRSLGVLALTRYDAGAMNSSAVLSSVLFNAASVVGGSSATGIVTLTAAAPVGGALVSLLNNSLAISVPASVTVPQGATTATFSVSTTPVGANTTATVTGSYNGVSGAGLLTITTAATTTTAPPPPPPAGVTLTVKATGRSGESVVSSPAGINAKVGTLSAASFAANTVITLSTSSKRDVVWSGSCSSGGNKAKSCTFTIKANASVTGSVQ